MVARGGQVMATAIAILCVTFCVTVLCSLVEACVLSLSKAEIAALGRRDAHLGRIWSGFRQRLSRPLGAILILNTGAQTIGMSLAAGRVEIAHGQTGVLVTSVVMAVLMIQWAEILP